ncbi:MAG TPA: DNA-directed RNA polymerase subunit omega [Acidimicrobiales bacterium]|nr:DNA-directed RNA polymerase subunit omega [Acidimicrobiales bacterium]
MADRRATMIHPPIEGLLGKVDSKFTLVTLASKRARQINSYFNQLGEGLGAIVPPQVASVSRKPLSIALEEIAAAKITWSRPDPDAEPAGDDAADEVSGEGDDVPALAGEAAADTPDAG